MYNVPQRITLLFLIKWNVIVFPSLYLFWNQIEILCFHNHIEFEKTLIHTSLWVVKKCLVDIILYFGMTFLIYIFNIWIFNYTIKKSIPYFGKKKRVHLLLTIKVLLLTIRILTTDVITPYFGLIPLSVYHSYDTFSGIQTRKEKKSNSVC